MEITAASFAATALAVFQYQARFNPLYARFLSLLGHSPEKIRRIGEIPHLPIGLFKKHSIQTGDWPPEMVFSSSGTTGAQTSRHFIRDLDWYRQISLRGFRQFYPPLSSFCILALLPSYLERSGSSLVFMVEEFMKHSHPYSGFFLDDLDQLLERHRQCRAENIPVLLIGVSFALLDLAEKSPNDLQDCIIVETGGMKGRRRELTRQELHQQLCSAFGCSTIHSEYGMTELLSQAWSKGEGLFEPSATMRLSAREINDPFAQVAYRRTGVLNIMDLGNLDTISFIATDDLGKVYEDGTFEVLGRMDGSDLRGCNLLLGQQ